MGKRGPDPLPEPPNATESDALGINQAGRIVGDATVPSSGGADVHAEFWDGVGAPTQVGPIASFGPGSDFGQANGVDAAGDVAGFTTAQSTTTPPTFQTTGFWARNGASPPATAGRGDSGPNGFSRVGAMTASGSLLLGSASTSAGSSYYLWPGASPNTPGTLLDINPTVNGFTLLGGGPPGVMMSSLASDGTVIGYRDSSGPNPVRNLLHPPPHRRRDPAHRFGRSQRRQWPTRRGRHDSAGSTVHAAIWRNGAVTDLNTLLPANSGFILSDALAINDNGDIVGVGAHNNQQVGFLLKLGVEAENVEITQGIQTQQLGHADDGRRPRIRGNERRLLHRRPARHRRADGSQGLRERSRQPAAAAPGLYARSCTPTPGARVRCLSFREARSPRAPDADARPGAALRLGWTPPGPTRSRCRRRGPSRARSRWSLTSTRRPRARRPVRAARMCSP